ncbi:MAG TPA: HD-GYP domain-containing protein [Bacillota bacterium]|jgi:putative nucleotidyltransferase with HDIG domain
MKLMAVNESILGLKAARSIYTSDGTLLLAAGKEVKEVYLNRLSELGVYSVYIDDGFQDDVNMEDVVSERTRVEALKTTRDAMTRIGAGAKASVQDISKVMDDLMDELMADPSLMLNLVDIRAINDYTFGHCVGVAVLSLMTAISLGYNQFDLKKIGMGALFHDLGKIKIPDSILYKPGPLSPLEWEEMKRHSAIGFELLRERGDFNIVSAHIAFQHHEKLDGTGYPRGIKGSEIHEFARVVALADVYDAITTDRPYRPRKLPHQAILIIRDGIRTHFDPNIVPAFISNVAIYPIGTVLVLNTGEKARVIEVQKRRPASPVVRVVAGADGLPVEGGRKIDLARSSDVHIVALHGQ